MAAARLGSRGAAESSSESRLGGSRRNPLQAGDPTSESGPIRCGSAGPRRARVLEQAGPRTGSRLAGEPGVVKRPQAEPAQDLGCGPPTPDGASFPTSVLWPKKRTAARRGRGPRLNVVAGERFEPATPGRESVRVPVGVEGILAQAAERIRARKSAPSSITPAEKSSPPQQNLWVTGGSGRSPSAWWSATSVARKVR